ncbi:MAG TPA: tetratricopeptide repeat protein [Thermoanaerobaculia bacterium]
MATSAQAARKAPAPGLEEASLFELRRGGSKITCTASDFGGEPQVNFEGKTFRGDAIRREIAVNLNNLAAIHQARGEAAEAERLYLRSLEIKEKILGPGHPDAALTIHNLASLFADLGRSGEARALYRHALDVFERTLGPAHPHSLACRASYEALP